MFCLPHYFLFTFEPGSLQIRQIPNVNVSGTTLCPRSSSGCNFTPKYEKSCQDILLKIQNIFASVFKTRWTLKLRYTLAFDFTSLTHVFIFVALDIYFLNYKALVFNFGT